MKRIPFPVAKAMAKMEPKFEDGQNSEEIENSLRRTYFEALVAPLETKEAANLERVLHYVRVRDAVDIAVENKENFVELPSNTFQYVQQLFVQFTGWNLQLADLIVLLSKELKLEEPKEDE